MLEAQVHHTMQFLHAHPHWGIVLTFFIAFAESLPVVGTIIPGSVTMTAIGVLVGTAVLPAIPAFAWAIVGAFIGDCVGYWLGVKYRDQIPNMWPFKKYGKYLIAGETFFAKHGGKSVLIGRFVGPVRSLIPLIAGILKLSTPRFILAAIPSAILWAVLYMLPGVALGALSLELPAGIATKFILGGLLLILLIWVIKVIVTLFFQQVWRVIDHSMQRLWTLLKSIKSLNWLTWLIAAPSKIDRHTQLSLAIFSLLSIFMTTFVICSALHHGFFTQINEPVYHFMMSLRTPLRDSIMTVITMLGDKWLMLIYSCIILAWLILQRYPRIAIHWFALMVLSFGSIHSIKHFWYSARPTTDLAGLTHSSLPSGHTTLITALLGFTVMLFAQRLHNNKRTTSYKILVTLILLMGISRLYLGAHWLSDVVAGILLGTSCLLVTTLSLRRLQTFKLPPTKFGIFAASALVVVWTAWGIMHYHGALKNYAPHWDSHTINKPNWWGQQNESIPLYRNNRMGRPIEPLNIQWLSPLELIEKELKQKGWVTHPCKANLRCTILRLAHQDSHRLPLLPQLYRNKTPALLLTKTVEKNKNHLILRLWASDITVVFNETPLWLGTVSRYRTPHKLLSNKTHAPKLFEDVTKIIIPDLEKFQWQRLKQTPEALQKTPPQLMWRGRVLQIQSSY